MNATFNQSDCSAAANNLGLSLIQELDPDKHPPTKPDFTLPWQSLGGDRRPALDYPDVGYKIALAGEGTSPFNFLQASYEDAQGVVKSQNIVKADEKQIQPSFIGLFSKHTFYAIMMLDFWNPIYSWKRGILMGYVPQTTNFNGKSYDLDPNFIANVKKSPKASEPDSPEYQFLQLLNKTLQDFQQMIRDYLTAVANRIKNDPVQALQDYLSLAESRRRIYRPLPLDEFGYTLPFATKIPFTPGKGLLEMTPQGTIQVMDQRGQDFLNAWTTSLAKPDPHVVPTPEAKNHSSEPGAPPLAISALPRPATLAIRCQSLTSQGSSSSSSLASRRSRRAGGGCPFRNQSVAKASSESSAKPGGTGAAGIPVRHASSSQPPNWTDDILPMLTAPYWVSGDPESTGRYWKEQMANFGGWDLSDYSDVAGKAVSIYRHVRTKSMPITDDPQNYWPDEAVEKFRAWVNAGCPRDSSTSQVTTAKEEAIPSPGAEASAHDLMVRRDIMSLTREELALYQSRLDDVLQSQSLESKWQELGILHAEWCLHYQEATFFWHRAHLRYMEQLIGHPIPYWNGFATAATDPASPYAGIPPVFLEETYVHPVDGTTRKNPLKYSLALNGKSKDGTSRYPVRRPVLVEGRRSSPDWVGQIRYLDKYHKQIIASLQTSTYSSPGGTAEGYGLPWANIVTFSEDQADSLYPYRTDFDGLFEQVHDNFHGWVGPDMADNTYTAFDPIFYSYHANMDRLLGIYLDSHAGSLQFTSDFPLQPFVIGGPTAPRQQQLGQVTVNYEEPRRWAFATIGDMARRSAALGYVYAPPASPDAWAPAVSPALAAHRGSVRPGGGRALTLWRDVVSAAAAARNNTVQEKAATKKKVPYVLFSGVGCTDESYSIEVFGPGQGELPGSGEKGSTVTPPQHEDYIGQVTRLGMGPGVDGKGGRNAGRCRRPEATRMLRVDDPRIAANLEKDPSVRLVVTRLQDGQVLGEEDYKGLSGFEPRVAWLTEE
ncbi:hypothetical protein DL765_009293 [Monosporascus sp. GIB2]|nr:hypothetical protein DL765_009293 [Monosporascus sp. GIB2]